MTASASFHRNDIDGLRAVAVVSVVLYHCGFARYFPGGFVGVDIFFVISGFLITGIVSSDIERGRFSLVEFYNRRVRRIFPALFTVYAFVLAASFLILMPSEISAVIRNTISSLLFVSNVNFYSQAGYFDTSSDFNALLHTWSLSVEEQFYVFFPLALNFMRHLSRRVVLTILGVVAVLSFAASVFMVQQDASAAFYLVQYRTWELLAGGLLSLGLAPRLSSPRTANVLAVLGLVLVAGSIFLLNNTSPFPGLGALPVCLGTCLLIHSGSSGQTMVGRLLSLPPVRFVGLISYSLYLWHWPVWVFGNQVHEAHTFAIRVSYIGLSFVLAALSWKFIEAPFRVRPYRTAPVRTLGYASLGMVTVLIASLLVPPAASAYWRVPPQVEEVAAFANYDANKSYRTGECFLTSEFNKFSMYRQDSCLALSDKKPNYLLVGDSHAAHMYPGMLAEGKDINILQASASGCKPIFDTYGDKRCTDLVKFVFNDFLPRHPVDTVVLSALWVDSDLPGLLREIAELKRYSKRVVVLGPIVLYDVALPRVLAKSLYEKDEALVATHRVSAVKGTDRLFAQAVPKTGADYVSVYDAICPAGACTLWTDDNKPIQFDYGHLTPEGSELIVSRIAPALFSTGHAGTQKTAQN
ncbi:acyltransferase family protein [Labrys okinawensis]|uniref:acyltransferase family protein n=1 Tax=Labrys okinawensis TaxID=346911 RepID=UPI0039BD0EAB